MWAPETAGVKQPLLSDKQSRSMCDVHFWGQVLRKYLRGIQGRLDLCFGGFNTCGEHNRPCLRFSLLVLLRKPSQLWLTCCSSFVMYCGCGRSVFCCIFLIFAFDGRSATLLMDHGAMAHLMFGWTAATRLLYRMREGMRQKFVRYVVTSATITACGECKEHYCCECNNTETCGNNIIDKGHSE